MRDANVWRALAEARDRTGRRLVLCRSPGAWHLFAGACLLGTWTHGEYAEAALDRIVGTSPHVPTN